MSPRPDALDSLVDAENPESQPARLDRLVRAGWIIALALSVMGASGCSGIGGEDGSSAQEATARWTLPASVRAVGSHVKINYENAPLWNGGASCTGKLREGSRALGSDLMDRFSQVKSIGGYACRRNTADSSRLSVHGTGKALDIFIPMRNGRASSDLGDPVANWLVTNAADIGIQLIIWNRSVWRANGTNEKPYGGPVPHTDHIHAELTEKAARKLTPYFEQRLEVEGGIADDGGITTTQPDVDAGDIPITPHDAGAADAHVAANDAGAPHVDAGAATPPTEDPAEDDYNPERDDDSEPGEEDSLGTGIREVPVAPLEQADDQKTVIGSCAAAPVGTTRSGAGGAGGASGFGLALALAATFVRRRRRDR